MHQLASDSVRRAVETRGRTRRQFPDAGFTHLQPAPTGVTFRPPPDGLCRDDRPRSFALSDARKRMNENPLVQAALAARPFRSTAMRRRVPWALIGRWEFTDGVSARDFAFEFVSAHASICAASTSTPG